MQGTWYTLKWLLLNTKQQLQSSIKTKCLWHGRTSWSTTHHLLQIGGLDAWIFGSDVTACANALGAILRRKTTYEKKKTDLFHICWNDIILFFIPASNWLWLADSSLLRIPYDVGWLRLTRTFTIKTNKKKADLDLWTSL